MSWHTPGPWEVGQDDRNGQAIVRSEHIEIATCWHHCVGSIEKEMRHNARLIAAAPDLLEALWIATEHNVLYFGEKHNTVIAGRAAIAKATGQST